MYHQEHNQAAIPTNIFDMLQQLANRFEIQKKFIEMLELRLVTFQNFHIFISRFKQTNDVWFILKKKTIKSSNEHLLRSIWIEFNCFYHFQQQPLLALYPPGL